MLRALQPPGQQPAAGCVSIARFTMSTLASPVSRHSELLYHAISHLAPIYLHQKRTGCKSWRPQPGSCCWVTEALRHAPTAATASNWTATQIGLEMVGLIPVCDASPSKPAGGFFVTAKCICMTRAVFTAYKPLNYELVEILSGRKYETTTAPCRLRGCRGRVSVFVHLDGKRLFQVLALRDVQGKHTGMRVEGRVTRKHMT